MSGYIGPIPVPQGIQNKETFTATAGQTTFNTNGYTDGAFISVYLNGVRLVNGTDYTSTNGSDVVLASGANAGDVLDFETFNSFSLASQQFENITTKNPTHEDTDGGRESAITFKGEQSGGEISTLAQIQASHDGTSDDQKGDLIFKTNDGSDNDAPTEAMRIDSEQNLGLGTNAPAHRLDIVESADAFAARITNNSDSSQGLQVRTSDNDTGEFILDLQSSSSATGTDYASKFVVEKGGNVGIGTTSIDVSTQAGGSGYRALQIESDEGGQLNFDHNDAGTGSTLGQINFQRAGEVLAEIEGVTDGATDNGRIAFRVQPDGGALTEKMRLDHNGTFLVGKTTDSAGTAGFKVETEGDTYITAQGGDGRCLYLNRLTSFGRIIELAKDDVTMGTIDSGFAGELSIAALGSSSSGMLMTESNQVRPMQNGSASDNTQDLGASNGRWNDAYITNGVTTGSDEREKQQIASLTSAEITAAKNLSKLFKTFKWNDAVEEKGDNARTHTGVIAQQVETAMSDAGLDAGDYAFFISTTWWEAERTIPAVEANEAKMIEAKEEHTVIDAYYVQSEAPEGATERNRKGIRYPELLAFIGAATEQRLTSIEARLDALEAE